MRWNIVFFSFVFVYLCFLYAPFINGGIVFVYILFFVDWRFKKLKWLVYISESTVFDRLFTKWVTTDRYAHEFMFLA